MRGVWYYVLIVVMGIVWKLVESISGPLGSLGFFFFLLTIIMKFLELESYAHTHHLYGPGLATTLATPKPQAVVPLAMPNEKGEVVEEKDFVIFKNHGTHWFAGSGGGKDSGYTACPAEYVVTMEGEEANVVINCDLEIYRWNPDEGSGEIDLESVPGPILDQLRRLKGWHERAPVWFGYLPWQSDFREKKVQMELAGVNKILEKKNKRLADELNEALKRLTKYSKTDKHVFDTYDRENRGRSRPPQEDREVID